MRIIRYDAKYKRYKKRFLKKKKKKKDKILSSYKDVLKYLLLDLPIPTSYKPYIVDKENRIWELHLVSYSSDYLLLYKKYIEASEKILYIYALTDHTGMNKILHGYVEEDLLLI